MSYLGKEVSTEYSSDSQYVSSEEHYTPFPSLTMSKKIELEKYIHNGEVTYNISTFSERLASYDAVAGFVPNPSRDDSGNRRFLSQDLRSLSSEPDIIEPEEQQQEDVSKQNPIIGCCLML